MFDTGDLRGGAGANGKGWTGGTYNSATGVVTFASTDSLGFSTGDLRGASGATMTTTQLSALMKTTQFTNNVGTGKIDIITTWKPTTAGIVDTVLKLVSSKNIVGVAFDGSISIAIPFTNIEGLSSALAGLQAKITSTAGQLIIGNAGQGLHISYYQVVQNLIHHPLDPFLPALQFAGIVPFISSGLA